MPRKPSTAPIMSPAQVEAAGRMLALLKQGGDVRQAKVQRLRRAIRAGTYLNSLKVEIAADRLLDQVIQGA